MGGVFALGMLALLVLFVCLTLFGVVCLVLALVFGLIYRGRAKKQKQGGDKVKTVWKVLPWAFLAAALLESGVDPDGRAGSGTDYTLLCTLAGDRLLWTGTDDASERKLAYERLLLEHGADVHHRVKVQERAKELPHSSAEAKDPSWITGAKHECGKTPLLLATERGDLASIKLFVAYGADINAVDDCGYNAILIAAQLLDDTQGGTDVLQYLLDNGCRADAQTHFGQNALDLIDQYEDDKQDAMRTLLMRYM